MIPQKVIKKHSTLLSLITLLGIVFLSFGQSLNFDLWQDDNALIFKLQHLQEQAGVFGPGALGLGAYRYIALPYVPIYETFGMNIPIFYLYALTFYFVAAVSVFLLAKQLTKNYFPAFLSGSIFAAGFIGSYGILRLFNSIQTSYSIVFVCLFFLFLSQFVRKMDRWNYLASLLMFFISLETAFIRTQYLILPALVFLILFLDWKKSKSRVTNLFLFAPFILVYNYVFSYSADSRAGLVKDYISNVAAGKFDYFHSFFGTLGNIVIPQPIQVFIFDWVKVFSLDYTNRLLVLKLMFLLGGLVLTNVILKKRKAFTRFLFSMVSLLWFAFGLAFFQDSEYIFTHSIDFDTLGIFSNFIGGLFLIAVAAIALTFTGRNKQVAKISLFLLAWMLSNILAYSTYLPFLPLESINRYLTHSLAAYSILIPLVFYSVNKKFGLLISLVIVFTNLILLINYQKTFVTEKSIPTRNFYNQLDSYLPEIKKDSVIYFDIASNKEIEQQFKDFFSVGSMPDTTAIAVRYKIDRYDFSMTTDFNEFVFLISSKPLDQVFSFFYGETGLTDTSDVIRSNLNKGSKIYVGDIQNIEVQNLSLISPAFLEFSAKVTPQVNLNENCNNLSQDKSATFDYLLSRDNYYKKVYVKTSSHERYQRPQLLIDENPQTVWRGNRGWWYSHNNEQINIDLGTIQEIGQILWINGYSNSTPTDYNIDVSRDGKTWQTVKSVFGGGKKSNGLLVQENISVETARYLRLTITKTFDNDAPAIGEIEVVEHGHESINKEDPQEIQSKALCAHNEDEAGFLKGYLIKVGLPGVVSWKSDKSQKNAQKFNFIADGNYHTYRIFLPAGGTRIIDLKIDSNYLPAKILVKSVIIDYQPVLE